MILLILFVGHILTANPQTISQRKTQPVVSLDTTFTTVNSKFILPVRFKGLDSLNATAYQFSLSYDPAFLTIDSINTQGTASEFGLLQANMDTPGVIYIAAAQNQPLSASGLLMELYGSTLDKTGTTSIHFDSFQFNEGEVATEAVHGIVHVREAEPEFSISADSINVLPNQVFDLPININSIPSPLYSGMFTVLYDPELLSPIDISTEETLLDIPEAIVDYSISSPGHLHVIFASSSALPNLSTPLLRLLFESTEKHGNSSIALVEVSMNEIEAPILIKNGMVSIIPPFMYGDTNEDQAITLIDAVIVLRHLLQISHLRDVAQQAADVSGNTIITSYDAALILRYIAGAILCFPADQNCSVDKHHQTAEDASLNEISPFYWSNRNSLQSTLTHNPLEGSHPVYSLDISIPRTVDMNAGIEIQSHLPEEWILVSEMSENNLQIKIAGPAPHPGGPLFSIQGVINYANISINGSSSFSPNEVRKNQDLSITSVFPVPFDQAAHVYYTMGRAADVNITLYDILGRRVKQILSAHKEAGEHRVRIGGHLLSPGIYLLQITTPDGLSDKISVVKR